MHGGLCLTGPRDSNYQVSVEYHVWGLSVSHLGILASSLIGQRQIGVTGFQSLSLRLQQDFLFIGSTMPSERMIAWQIIWHRVIKAQVFTDGEHIMVKRITG